MLKKLCVSLVIVGSFFIGLAQPQYANADSLCFNQTIPTPVPASGAPTLGLCTGANNSLNVNVTGGVPTSGPTVAPGPTDANGIPLVHPTAVGTLTVICASGCGAVAYPTTAAGYLIVAPTALPTQTIQGCAGCVAVPVSIATSLAIIPAQVNACNVGFTACSNVGTTVTDGYSDLLESLFSTGFAYVFNGTSWDRQRDVQGVGNNTSGLGLDAVGGYVQYNTVLPTPSPGNYSALQGDSSGRLLISPIGLPTPQPQPTSASLYPKTVQCDPTTAANCAIVSSSGVTDSAVCTIGAICSVVGNPSDAAANAQNTLYTFGLGGVFNGTTWDRARSAGIGNTVASTGLSAHVPYCENLTTLPTLTTGTYGAVQCDTSGRLLISPTSIPTPAPTPAAVATTVASSATSVTLLAANTAINGVSFCNNSTSIAYLSMTTPATATTFFVPIPAAGTVPQCIVQSGVGLYRGAWYGIWASANGTMIVTYW